jgi:hypothetical protein
MVRNDDMTGDYDDDLAYEDPDCLVRGDQVDDMLQCLSAGPDPLDFSNPDGAYELLNDEAQDEIQGAGGKKLKCMSCGHVFMGEVYDDCPECMSPDNREIG